MNYEEAQAWLNGERSMCNIIPHDPFETWQVRIAQADAAMTQQAYWIVKAYHDKQKGREPTSKIRIRFDGPPGPEAGRFIEVENEHGESIRFGEWKQDGDDWILEFPYDCPIPGKQEGGKG